ncbi:MAG: hypothetical protein IPM21_01775 [Acidobacteria bacterium]|nr:hypothetical protein [Acidobacteriota bacterium]
MFDNSYTTIFRKVYLFTALPEPLTPASEHVQLFDNYLPETGLRLRSLRIPETKAWRYFFDQERAEFAAVRTIKRAAMELDEKEYAHLQMFEGNEIRKNRYFAQLNARPATLDIYLGELWGLNVATVEFADESEALAYPQPEIAVADVSADAFFTGPNLVQLKFADVQAHLASE